MTFRKIQTALFLFSLVLIFASVFALGFFGLKFGIEFTGGSILEVQYIEDRPTVGEVQESLKNINLESLSVQSAGEKRMIMRTRDLTQAEHMDLISSLGKVEELRFESIGPAIGKELRDKALMLALISTLSIVLYIGFAFRRVAGEVMPWQWSLAATATTAHDVILPIGIFALLGHFQGVQITIPVLVGVLTVIGYSINDTVVVFDRIRENLVKRIGFDFEDTVKQSLRQTWFRSFSTSFTTLLVLFALYFLGGSSLKDFSLMLILGVIAGTWSSLFFAPTFLLRWHGRKII